MKKLSLILKVLFFLTDLIIPKRKMYVFCSKTGLREGNTFTLYQYFRSHSTESYFITEPYTLNSLWRSLRAKTIIMSHGPGDIPYALHCFRKNVVYLGHGITIKKMLFEDEKLPLKRRIISGIESRFYSHVIASSTRDAENLSKVFRLPKDRMFITGLPRNDIFDSGNKNIEDVFGTGSYILYAPTYRAETETFIFPFENFDIESFNEQLKSHNTYIVLRLHPNDKADREEVFRFSNILNGNIQELESIQPYLFSFKTLLTDYSSIYIDYLLSDQKIGFIPYDLEHYKATTGLFYEYEEVTPGPHLSSQEDLELLIFGGNDHYKKARATVRNIFYKFSDCKACERILKLLS